MRGIKSGSCTETGATSAAMSSTTSFSSPSSSFSFFFLLLPLRDLLLGHEPKNGGPFHTGERGPGLPCHIRTASSRSSCWSSASSGPSLIAKSPTSWSSSARKCHTWERQLFEEDSLGGGGVVVVVLTARLTYVSVQIRHQIPGVMSLCLCTRPPKIYPAPQLSKRTVDDRREHSANGIVTGKPAMHV